MDNNEAIKALEAVSSDFATSLVRQFNQRGDLSPKQWPWVHKLVAEATGGDTREVTSLGDLSGVYHLMEIASNFIKWPKIQLVTDDGEIVKLVRAGSRSKYPGQINVTDEGGYGNNTWFGRIDKNGDITKSRHCTDQVIDVLKRLGKDPHQVAAEYGNKFSECCFCCKALTDDKSVAAGYGPTCAKNYGLQENWKAALNQTTVDFRATPQSDSDRLGFDNGSQ